MADPKPLSGHDHDPRERQVYVQPDPVDFRQRGRARPRLLCLRHQLRGRAGQSQDAESQPIIAIANLVVRPGAITLAPFVTPTP